MSLSDTQLDQLGHEVDQNQREMVVLGIEHANMLVMERNASYGLGTQQPQVCPRTQPSMLDGLRGGTQSIYNATLHPLVNTTWAVPSALGAYDAYNITRLLSDIGGFGTKVRISVKNGKEYVVITGYPGLRRRLNGTRYGIRNAQLVEMGIGRYGLQKGVIKGFKISCYVAVIIEVLEWVFNDERVWSDLFAGVGVELIKAGIATAIGYAAGVAAGAFFVTAALPVVTVAIVVLVVGIGLNELDNRYNIKSSVKSGMRYAVDNVAELHEKLSRISAKDLQVYTEELATSIIQKLMDTAVDETKSWILKKIQPGELPLPNWPNAPELPNFSNFKLPRF
ncbi:hypothetical protein PSTH1771_27675 [Pseudomonas syringae pv. theae]|uniref:hypothetical protein n=1 Tax=Pseudomonas syringae group TaxID=136849 RepID=UPI000EFF2A98|nr:MULTISPECIES: hypothetical protein [Pseudomonas syringae group]MBL3831410.1 hypothetical protein [Pseudomonas syringae pv. theae]MBL3834199.1 hypothetical protein [Pseudomonas syringae pv. theae]MBL3869617.1 hypothetical protein [Pseudomonas syringae pv. theae]MCQ3018381.1 hypothetical protein [Pseudomonas tremae]QGL59269.1 hypothetical protein POR16_24495 [Pseudomonas coronafaciens pv. oryzae str. 1_6]